MAGNFRGVLNFVTFVVDLAVWKFSTHENKSLRHRLQLSLNLRDSPGFLATVPRPGRLYYNCIIGPGRGPDTGINTVVVVQLVTYLKMNKLLVVPYKLWFLQ